MLREKKTTIYWFNNLSNMTCSISKKTVCLNLSLNYQSILSDIFVEAIIISIVVVSQHMTHYNDVTDISALLPY